MSKINLFKKNKESRLKPMDDYAYKFKLYRIPKNIKIDTSLSRKDNILRVDADEVDVILGQVLIAPETFFNSEIIAYVRELATGKLIPICYIEKGWWNKAICKWLQDSSPIYVEYKKIVDDRTPLEIIATRRVAESCSIDVPTIKERNARLMRQNIASLDEIEKYLQERRPNEDSSAYLAKLNEYFYQAEGYYRLAENKVKSEEEGIKQIVKSINKG